MENSELKNFKNPWFKSVLFGKKNKNLYKKNITCTLCKNCQRKKKDETIQTDIYSYNKEQLNVNDFENPKQTPTNEVCPGNVFPIEHRGCGFQLYFCIDKMRKSDFAKSKKTKRANYELPLPDDKIRDLAETKNNIPSYSPLQSPRTVNKKKFNLIRKKHSPSKTTESLPERTNIKIGKKYKRNKSSNNLRTQEEVKGGGGIRTKKISYISLLSNARGKSTGKIPVVRVSSAEPSVYSNIEMKRIKPTNKEKNQTDCSKSCQGSDQEEEEIFKEYEVLKKPVLKRRTTEISSPFLVNNLNLQKNMNSSTTDMVNQILKKLCKIEEKITELETIHRKKVKKITNIVGISCNKANSTLSINTNRMAESEKQTLPENGQNCNTTDLIKSQGEHVNTVENVSATNIRRSRNGSNAQEIQAYNILANSSVKSNMNKGPNPKTRPAEVFPKSIRDTKDEVPKSGEELLRS